ncbi:MAG: ribonuclease PH, partial [Christensenellaceae bacterium]
REGLKPDGRSTEITRLIGRSLRAALDFEKLGDYSIWIDCDVLEADGGTRTASITGAWAALRLGVDRWLQQGILSVDPIIHQIAAVSVGIVEDEPRLDLCYQEDSSAQVDMNLVMDETGAFIEVQGTGEGRAFTRSEMNAMLSMGEAGIRSLFALQQQAVEESRL